MVLQYYCDIAAAGCASGFLFRRDVEKPILRKRAGPTPQGYTVNGSRKPGYDSGCGIWCRYGGTGEADGRSEVGRGQAAWKTIRSRFTGGD